MVPAASFIDRERGGAVTLTVAALASAEHVLPRKDFGDCSDDITATVVQV
jgi:hypothetical protein